jgi:NADH:ubiquinone reductase (H+-translocating)
MTRSEIPRILVVGGGYVGMYSALRMQRLLRRDEAKITVVDPDSYMTYQPFLSEAAAGSLEPRHLVVPLRKVLNRCEILNGHVVAIDHEHRNARFEPVAGHTVDINYDVLVFAAGSIARTMPIPGLAECGIGFRTVEEAIYLRNQVLSHLDVAASTADEEVRRRALTFMFIGAGYAGVEGLAELEDMASDAVRFYPTLSRDDMRWVMIEASPRVLPEVSQDLADYTVRQLETRGIEVRLSTRVESMVGGKVELSDGTQFESDTIVWTAGVRANPLLEASDLPLDAKKRVRCTSKLRVAGIDNAWAAGDSAAVPDLSKDDPDALCGPTAQHAMRQAKQLASNVVADLRGKPGGDYRHTYAGSVASLGLHRGVAEVYGVKVKGMLAWLMHRTYHVSRMPTLNRKVRVITDWTLALFFDREIVSFGSSSDPRRDFSNATNR